MDGNESKWDLLTKGIVEYFFDANGDLWKGPTSPNDNLHYAKFEGFTDTGEMIWVCSRSDAPEMKLTAQQLEDFMYRELRKRHREAARKELKKLATHI